MKISNRTKLDSTYLATIFNHCIPPGLDDETLLIFEYVDNRQTPSGLAWGRDAKFAGCIPHAFINVPRVSVFPSYPPPVKSRRASHPGWTVKLATLEEALIYVTAHECGHLRYGPSERGAHAWGMRALRRYRRHGLAQPKEIRRAA